MAGPQPLDTIYPQICLYLLKSIYVWTSGMTQRLGLVKEEDNITPPNPVTVHNDKTDAPSYNRDSSYCRGLSLGLLCFRLVLRCDQKTAHIQNQILTHNYF